MAKSTELAETPIVGEGASEVAAQQPTDGAEESRQPINLDELAEFRQWKSQMDKTIAQERKEREALQQRYEAQLAEQAQRLRQQQLAGMDDGERIHFEREEAIREAAYWREQAQRLQLDSARDRELGQISQRFGVPREAIEGATSKAEALELAWNYREQQQHEQARQRDAESAERQAQRAERRVANRVDTGAGKPTQAPDFEQKLAAAKKSGSALELAKLLYS